MALNDDKLAIRLQNALKSGDWNLLVRLARQALRKNGKYQSAHRLLGFALHRLRRYDDALVAFKKAYTLFPDDAELLINYGNALLEQAKPQLALPLLERVVELRPDHTTTWVKLGQACYPLGLHQKGFDASQKALATAKDMVQRVHALTQSAIHRRELGQVREAVKDCEESIRLAPADPSGHTNRMLFMLADPACTTADMLAAAQAYAQVFEAPLRSQWSSFSEVNRNPWRKLRVGFISPDFRHHAVMYFIEGMLSQLDRSQFELWAFYLSHQEDTATERVRCHVEHFVPIAGFSPQEQALAIQEASIDILIDLAGHTGGNGLLAMARKPAPIQISTIGYPGTTGLQAMDWWLSDGITDPPGAECQYVERLYRLPTRWVCYRPMSRNPLWRYQPAYQVRETPALANGFITFGSCNNLGKLTDEVLTLWGQLLASTPNARLLIEGKGLGATDTSARYRARCAQLGIDVDRLDLVPLDGANQYLTYHRIDIALDPFPLVGGTTTNDLLWMGIPVVTLNGDSLRNRIGVGILAHLGRHEWIARTQKEYLEIAKGLAEDVTALNTTRMNLRVDVENSVLMREDVFVQELGKALRNMWLQWLANQNHPEWSPLQIQTWVTEMQAQAALDALPPQEFIVGIAPGQRVPLTQAYARLQELLTLAQHEGMPKDKPPQDGQTILLGKGWLAATELAERILCAKPHDPVALTALAEIENVHGHLDFGRVYLAQALESLKGSEPATHVLKRTQGYIQQALSHLGEAHLEQRPPI